MSYVDEAGGAFSAMAKRNCLVNGLDLNHLISASGTVDPHSSGRYVINAGSAAALTLGAPTAGTEDGLCIQILSSTNYAHTLTATGLLQTGSASVNEATFGAYAGAGLTLMAFNGYWIVLESNQITFS